MSFSHLARWLAPSIFVLAAAPALADVYRCQQSNGQYAYQDMPCTTGAQKTINTRANEVPTSAVPVPDYKPVLAELERKRLLRDAIASSRPMVSMTRSELEQAIGYPNKINASQYGASLQDQLIYYRHGRTLYVYTKDGVVTSIQDTEGTASTQRKPCPSASDIWGIEVEISKFANRDNYQLQTELHKRLLDAKACH